jgi:hypothetical protein
MRIRPILFNTEMVRAILNGQKTMTRRAIKNLDIEENKGMVTLYKKNEYDAFCISPIEVAKKEMLQYCPVQPGDILYVRETWHIYRKLIGEGYNCHLGELYGYKASIANSEDANTPWRPSIHMPKAAARIWLKVTNVRVEKLQDITEEDAKQEGIGEEWAMSWWRPTYYDPDSGGYPRYRDTFAHDLWDSTIKKSDLDTYGWHANPYVFVIEFERCEKPKEEV